MPLALFGSTRRHLAGEILPLCYFYLAAHCTGCVMCCCNTHRLFFLTCHHHFVVVPAVPRLGNLSNSFPLCGRALYRVCCTSCNTQRLSLLRCHHQYVAVPGISCLGKPSHFAPFILPCIVQGVLYVPAVPIAYFSLCGMTILWQYPPSPGWGNLGSSFLPCSRAMYSMH